MKWAGWEGRPDEVTWVKLNNNPELANYVRLNQANPNSCTAIRERLLATTPPDARVNDPDVQVIRQVIFDELGGARFTREGDEGFVKRVSVTLPFGREAFERLFCPVLGLERGCHTDTTMSADDLSRVLGPGWDKRSFPTSTETFVSRKSSIRIKWTFKPRHSYSHSQCTRYFNNIVPLLVVS